MAMRSRGMREPRLPWDARVVSVTAWVSAVVSFLAGAILCIPGVEAVDPVRFLGLIPMNGLWLGLYFIGFSVAVAVAGYGIWKGTRYGWWLIVCTVPAGLPASVAAIPEAGYKAAPSLIMAALLLLWCVFRARLYDPLFRESRAGGSAEGDSSA